MGKIKFGTGGFRAIIDEAFNKENVRLVAEALSLIIEEENAKKEVVICYDRRNYSPEAGLEMAKVLASHNIRVILQILILQHLQQFIIQWLEIMIME